MAIVAAAVNGSTSPGLASVNHTHEVLAQAAPVRHIATASAVSVVPMTFPVFILLPPNKYESPPFFVLLDVKRGNKFQLYSFAWE